MLKHRLILQCRGLENKVAVWSPHTTSLIGFTQSMLSSRCRPLNAALLPPAKSISPSWTRDLHAAAWQTTPTFGLQKDACLNLHLSLVLGLAVTCVLCCLLFSCSDGVEPCLRLVIEPFALFNSWLFILLCVYGLFHAPLFINYEIEGERLFVAC